MTAETVFGAGSGGAVETYFAYEDGQIVLQWEDGGGDDPAPTQRYLWAEAVDFFLAAEVISTPGLAGDLLKVRLQAAQPK